VQQVVGTTFCLKQQADEQEHAEPLLHYSSLDTSDKRLLKQPAAVK
jgi:hypothetical protein